MPRASATLGAAAHQAATCAASRRGSAAPAARPPSRSGRQAWAHSRSVWGSSSKRSQMPRRA
eukprot:8330649-Pyramimonas_sp.AAC.1